MENKNSTLVIKLGGAKGVDFSAICQDVVRLKDQGKRLILVHGGSAEANQLGETLNYPPRFITSPSGFTSRYTDRRTLEIFIMAVNGKVNTLLVEQLQSMGVNALGLSGLDGRLLAATRKKAIRSIQNGKQKVIRDDYTGKIKRVNTSLVNSLLDNGYTCVVAPLAVSEEGEALNVDADRAAAAIAAALQSDVLLLLTAVPGLMRAFPDKSTLINKTPRSQLGDAMQFAEGRMKKKILGAEEALNGGVKKVIIASGDIESPIFNALAEHGTVIE